MRTQCIQAVARALGRSPTAVEVKRIEDRIRENRQQLWKDDRQRMLGLTEAEQIAEAGKLAATQIKHEAALKQKRIARTIIVHDQIENMLNATPGNWLDTLTNKIVMKVSFGGYQNSP
jgi:hypothetical protein